MPPYIKVYAWECVELTDDELAITGEPTFEGNCVVRWLTNGAEQPDSQVEKAVGSEIAKGDIPTLSRSGFSFTGWLGMSGVVYRDVVAGGETMNELVGMPVNENQTYVAQWKSNKHTVTFHGNGGEPDLMTREYDDGQPIGYFPTMEKYPTGAEGVVGWFTAASGGTQMTATYQVKSDLELWVHWKGYEPKLYTVRFYKDDGTTELEPLRKTNIVEGSTVGDLSSSQYTNPYSKVGHTFMGWYTTTSGGTRATEALRVFSNIKLYAQWSADAYTVIWDPNYSGASTTTWTRDYGAKVGTPPVATRTGYT